MIIPTHWTFKDAGVAAAFDAHVREQLPWYEWATETVAHVCRHYIPQRGIVYDIGASTGNIGRAIADVLEAREANLWAVENSPHMANLYDGPGCVFLADAVQFDYKPFDVAVCFLTLMFLSPLERAELLAKLRRNVRPRGAIIIVDKLEPADGYLGLVMTRLALAQKLRAGVPAQQILEKELSLSGVQRPLLLTELGPDATEIFRFGDFAGWVISGGV